jgi:hypothetical protein
LSGNGYEVDGDNHTSEDNLELAPVSKEQRPKRGGRVQNHPIAGLRAAYTLVVLFGQAKEKVIPNVGMRRFRDEIQVARFRPVRCKSFSINPGGSCRGTLAHGTTGHCGPLIRASSVLIQAK